MSYPQTFTSIVEWPCFMAQKSGHRELRQRHTSNSLCFKIFYFIFVIFFSFRGRAIEVYCSIMSQISDKKIDRNKFRVRRFARQNQALKGAFSYFVFNREQQKNITFLISPSYCCDHLNTVYILWLSAFNYKMYIKKSKVSTWTCRKRKHLYATKNRYLNYILSPIKM